MNTGTWKDLFHQDIATPEGKQQLSGLLHLLYDTQIQQTRAHRSLSVALTLWSVKQSGCLLGLTAAECLHLCIPLCDESLAILKSKVWTWPVVLQLWHTQTCPAESSLYCAHTPLSFSAVPLECKPPVSLQNDILGLQHFPSISSTIIYKQSPANTWYLFGSAANASSVRSEWMELWHIFSVNKFF